MCEIHWNVCKYENCGDTFPNLHELICHIETTHLDFDTESIEKYENSNMDLIPFSYVLKYTRDEDVEESHWNSKRKMKTTIKLTDDMNNNIVSSESLVAPSFNDDWLNETQYHRNLCCIPQQSQLTTKKLKKLKKYECPLPGCYKRYKNINGIKYHIKRAHDQQFGYKRYKEYKCHCGKSYKTAKGLKAHNMIHEYNPGSNNLYESLEVDRDRNTVKCIVEQATEIHIPEYSSIEYQNNDTWENDI